MSSVEVKVAREKLQQLLEEVAETHEPIAITGEGRSAILVSEDDWRSIQETLHLLSVPGMRESIIEGMQTPLDRCSEDPGW